MSKKLDNYFEIYEKVRDRRRIKLYNLGQDLKILSLFIIGIPLAMIFFLAWFGFIKIFGESYPTTVIYSYIIFMFLYGCFLHDLIRPYLKKNYKKVPPLPK